MEWKPAKHFSKGKKSSPWDKLVFALGSRKGFGNDVDVKALDIVYSKNKNSLVMKNNKLNGNTIKQFWEALKEEKKTRVMNFVISVESGDNMDDEKLNKKQEYYLSVEYDNKKLAWSPNTLSDIDWSQQFDKLKQDVCAYFKLEKNDELAFMSTDLDQVIKNETDIENLWDMEVDDSEEKFASLQVIKAMKINRAKNEDVCAVFLFLFFALCCFVCNFVVSGSFGCLVFCCAFLYGFLIWCL